MYTPLFSGLGIFDCDFLQALKTNHIHSLNFNHYENKTILNKGLFKILLLDIVILGIFKTS